MAQGWREARLYQNRGRFRFPCGEDYGLVCFVDGDFALGEVTRQSIEIVGPPPWETILHFYNPDVEQPWQSLAYISNRPFSKPAKIVEWETIPSTSGNTC